MQVQDASSDRNPFAVHYSRFRVDQRLLLDGHSMQAWPDVALEGLHQAWSDAAELGSQRWERAYAKGDRVRTGYRQLLGDTDPGSEYALRQNAHELLVILLSTIELRQRPRVVTSDSEFLSAARQFMRLEEEGVEICRVPIDPVDSFAERLNSEINANTGLIYCSTVTFDRSLVIPHLAALARARRSLGVPLVLDTYHHLGALPFRLEAIDALDAFVLGGGYKYLQLGEGNAFLRVPGNAADVVSTPTLRPIITGWFADAPGEIKNQIGYAPGSARWSSGSYDPTSNYRAARVFDFFAEHGLTPEQLRAISQFQTGFMIEQFEALDLDPGRIALYDKLSLDERGGFLSFRCSDAQSLSRRLVQEGIRCNARGDALRFGPAPYLNLRQLDDAIASLGETVRSTH